MFDFSFGEMMVAQTILYNMLDGIELIRIVIIISLLKTTWLEPTWIVLGFPHAIYDRSEPPVSCSWVPYWDHNSSKVQAC